MDHWFSNGCCKCGRKTKWKEMNSGHAKI
jgi:hypothetical protein